MVTGDDLPLPIIQHIQSYLDWKDAVRSSLLSKQWYTSWSTRPQLELNQLHFGYNPRTDFHDYARNTLKRYQELNLKLESLRLRMLMADGDYELANELISHALKLGLNKLNFGAFFGMYNLPDEVFDHSVSLTTLSLQGCRIDRGVNCSSIVSLELCRVNVRALVMRNILVGCPSIENLSLVSCKFLRRVDLSLVHRNLKHFTARQFTPSRCYEDLSVRFKAHRYPNLISLQLDGSVETDQDMFLISNFQDRFPCMQKFALDSEVVTSQYFIIGFSVKQLSFHVPDATHSRLGSLTSAECKYIELSVSRFLHASWFLELRNFLQESSSSGTSLVIKTGGIPHIRSVEDIQCVTATLPVVENLTIHETAKLFNFELLCGLFWSCRPKFVTLIGSFSGKNNVELLYEELKKVEKCVKSIHAFYCVHGLEEVDMEVYEEGLKVWRPAPCEGLEDSIAGEQVRLRLRWLSV